MPTLAVLQQQRNQYPGRNTIEPPCLFTLAIILQVRGCHARRWRETPRGAHERTPVGARQARPSRKAVESKHKERQESEGVWSPGPYSNEIGRNGFARRRREGRLWIYIFKSEKRLLYKDPPMRSVVFSYPPMRLFVFSDQTHNTRPTFQQPSFNSTGENKALHVRSRSRTALYYCTAAVGVSIRFSTGDHS